MRIALIENTGKDFFISRMRLAKFLKKKGNDVTAIIPKDGFAQKIEDEGLKVIVVGTNIRGKGVENKLKFAFDLYRILKNSNFDLIHCFRMQPNIIGGFLGGILGHRKIFNHITGLGIVFTKNSFKYKIQQRIIKFCYKFNSRIFNTKYIFQNKYDVLDIGITKNYVVIPGSAVNEDIFFPREKVNVEKVKGIHIDSDQKIILFVSRLIKSKGLSDLVEAIQKVNEEHSLNCKLLVVGWVDSQNINSHTLDEINSFEEKASVSFLGEREDVHKLIALSDVCVLPTYYREGTPRFLLEAMASGKPIITTRMPGCDHLVYNSTNGILVNKKSPLEIALGLNYIFNNNYDEMCKNSKALYDSYFSECIVYHGIYEFYHKNDTGQSNY